MTDFGMHRLAFLFVLIFGVILVFVTPIYQIPDEPNHFLRAYQISEGDFRSNIYEDGNVAVFYTHTPISFLFTDYFSDLPNFFAKPNKPFTLDKLKETLNIPLNVGERQYFPIPNTGNYAPTLYFPQAVGAFLARQVSSSAGIIFFAMRLFAVIFTALCVALSIKLLPEKKLLIFLVAVMPMFLAQVSSINADAVLFSIAVLFSAYILSLTAKDKQFTKYTWLKLACIAVILGLSKQVYGVILLLYLLIPRDNVGGIKKFFVGFVGLIAIYVLSLSFWSMYAAQGHIILPHVDSNEAVSIEGQMDYVAKHPLHLVGAFAHTLYESKEFFLESFVGQLGWLNVHLPKHFYQVYLTVLFFAGASGRLNVSLKGRLLMLAGTALSAVTFFFYHYFTWTPVGAEKIMGCQGRYFIPLAIMFFGALSYFNKFRYENIMACFFGLVSFGVTLYTLLDFYW